MMLNRAIATALVLTFSISSVAPLRTAFADVTAPAKVVITGENLHELLFANNTDTIRAQNNVLRARDQVNLVRSNLIPQLSLNLVLTITTSPMFMVSSVSCLVPFLFPSNWLNLDASKKTYGAEVQAFHAAKLNTYATALQLVSRVGTDEAILHVLEEQYTRVEQYVNGLRLQYELGLIPHSDVLRGELDTGRFQLDLSKTRQLVEEERAAVRKMMGMPLTTDFEITLVDVAPSRFERLSPAQALDVMATRAPERRQIDLLIMAARANLKASYWGFLQGCSGSQGGVNSGGGGGFNFSTGTSITLGFGYFPAIQLAKRNITDMEIRAQELRLELGRSLEATLSAIHESATRMQQAERNAATAEALLTEQNQLFELGRVGVKEILESFGSITAARIEQMNSRAVLAGHRVTLRRMSIEDRFMDVYVQSRREIELPVRR